MELVASAIDTRFDQSRLKQLLKLFVGLFISDLRIFCLLFLTLTTLISTPLIARTVRIGVYENAPKVYFDDSGDPAGFFIEIIEEIAKDEGWTLEFVKVNWDAGLRLVETGELDLMPDVAITSERNKRFLFHDTAVLSSWSQVYVPRDEMVSSVLDLQNKRIATLEGSVHGQALFELAQGFDIKISLVSCQA